MTGIRARRHCCASTAVVALRLAASRLGFGVLTDNEETEFSTMTSGIRTRLRLESRLVMFGTHMTRPAAHPAQLDVSSYRAAPSVQGKPEAFPVYRGVVEDSAFWWRPIPVAALTYVFQGDSDAALHRRLQAHYITAMDPCLQLETFQMNV